jgi:predicted nucleotidyltransferase
MERYCALLRERLGERLVEIRLFGSAARGDMWASHWPMHSDIDLLVVTRGAIPDEVQHQLINETYALFLACGRQLSPQFQAEATI